MDKRGLTTGLVYFIFLLFVSSIILPLAFAEQIACSQLVADATAIRTLDDYLAFERLNAELRSTADPEIDIDFEVVIVKLNDDPKLVSDLETLAQGFARHGGKELREQYLPLIRTQGPIQPRYGSFILEDILHENQRAYSALRTGMLHTNPDAVIAMERGGALVGESIVRGTPLESRLTVLQKSFDPTGKFRFDPASVIEQIQQKIDAVKAGNLEAGLSDKPITIAITDSFFGGRFSSELKQNVLRELIQRPENKNVFFESYWIRERFGLEKETAEGFVPVVAEADLGFSKGSPYAPHYKVTMADTRMVIGDDVDLFFDGSAKPLFIFDNDGKVKQIIRPKTTSRNELVQLMGSSAVPSSSFHVTIPPGAAKTGFMHLEELRRLSDEGKYEKAWSYFSRFKGELLPDDSAKLEPFLQKNRVIQRAKMSDLEAWLGTPAGQSFLATQEGAVWYGEHKQNWLFGIFQRGTLKRKTLEAPDAFPAAFIEDSKYAAKPGRVLEVNTLSEKAYLTEGATDELFTPENILAAAGPTDNPDRLVLSALVDPNTGSFKILSPGTKYDLVDADEGKIFVLLYPDREGRIHGTRAIMVRNGEVNLMDRKAMADQELLDRFGNAALDEYHARYFPEAGAPVKEVPALVAPVPASAPVLSPPRPHAVREEIRPIDYDLLQVIRILDVKSGDAGVQEERLRKIASAYTAEVGFLDSGAPTPQLTKLIDDGLLTPDELEKLRKGAPLVMGGMVEEDLAARVARHFPISEEERISKKGAEHISELERIINEGKENDAYQYLLLHKTELEPEDVALLREYIFSFRHEPLNINTPAQSIKFRGDLESLLNSIPFNNYNRQNVRFTGSAVTGESAKTGKLFGSGSDLDLSIVVDDMQYNELVKTIESKLLEGKDIEKYTASKEYREFRKEVQKGKLSKYWLNKISGDKALSFNLQTMAETYGYKGVDLSFIQQGSSFDTPVFIPVFAE